MRHLLQRMLGHQTTPPPTPAVVPPPLPDPLPDSEREELRQAQWRVSRKWQRFDGLLSQFNETDVVLRVERR